MGDKHDTGLGLDVSVAEAAVQILDDAIPDISENIFGLLAFDGRSLLTLGNVNKFWRERVRDPALWNRLNALRFGYNPTSSLVPAQPATAIPGWCFFPGFDSPDSVWDKPDDAQGQLQPHQLAAVAERKHAIAFNTEGSITHKLLSKLSWKHCSFTPGVGMYVREEAVIRVLGSSLPPALPPHAEPQVRPPDFPGWVFYHLMDSPGGDIQHPASLHADFMSTCITLLELEEVASRFPNCVAFTTTGHLKQTLHPQVHWRQTGGPCSWSGMYVREEVVAERRLRRPQPGDLPDALLRYFHLSRDRLRAARDVDVVWLNGEYLERVPDPAPGLLELPMEVVQLNAVCWLELNGMFRGVGPGRYRCSWILRAKGFYVPELNLKVTLRSARQLGFVGRSSSTPAATSSVGELCSQTTGAAATTATAAARPPPSSRGGEGDVPSPGTVLDSLVATTLELSQKVGPGWFEQPAGEFEVPVGWVYDVEVQLWNHGANWKRGLWFKELLLNPVGQGREVAPSSSVS